MANASLDITDLLELNRNHLFKKLDRIKCDRHIYVVNDIIDILSSTPSRDKSRTNKYGAEFIYLGYSRRGNSIRQVRLFTDAGIEHYLLDGNITNYQDACLYFNITPIDKQREKYIKQFNRIKQKCVDGLYKTSILLSWIYDKRKYISKLPDYIDLNNAIEFISTHETVDTPNLKKISLAKEYS